MAPVTAAEGMAEAEDRLFVFGAWVELSAEGRVEAATLPADTTLQPALHGPLIQGIEAQVFEPARVDGVARPSRSWLQGRLRLLPQDESYRILVEAEHLGPRPLQPFRPRTGRPPDKPVRVLLGFEVTAEGRTRKLEVTAMDKLPSGMAKALTDSLRSLRFEPEEVDGQPVASMLRWPFQVRRDASPELPFDLPPLARDPQRPGVSGQDAYAPTIVHSMVLRRAVTITL